jgi:hypothetical protein
MSDHKRMLTFMRPRLRDMEMGAELFRQMQEGEWAWPYPDRRPPYVMTWDLSVGDLTEAEVLFTVWERRIWAAHAGYEEGHPSILPPPTLEERVPFSWAELPRVSKDFWHYVAADLARVREAQADVDFTMNAIAPLVREWMDRHE